MYYVIIVFNLASIKWISIFKLTNNRQILRQTFITPTMHHSIMACETTDTYSGQNAHLFIPTAYR